MAAPRNRLEEPWLDAALHLLDRQVVDTEGMMVCNVDDLELSEDAGGELAVTGLLVGPAALVPRYSGRLGNWLRKMWLSLGVQYADRDVPLYVGLGLVEHVGSDIVLKVARTGLLDRQPAAAPGVNLRRIDNLLGLEVFRDEQRLGQVIDVRLQPKRTQVRLVVTSLIVGRGGPGSLLGYDRGDFNGPFLVQRMVWYIHRHTVQVPIESVEELDWNASRIEVSGPVEPLRTSSRDGNGHTPGNNPRLDKG